MRRDATRRAERETESWGLTASVICLFYFHDAAAFKAVKDAAKAGVKVVDLCDIGDKALESETGKYYNKKDKDGNKVEKGVAFRRA